jgi:hypothetical protein
MTKNTNRRAFLRKSATTLTTATVPAAVILN